MLSRFSHSYTRPLSRDSRHIGWMEHSGGDRPGVTPCWKSGGGGLLEKLESGRRCVTGQIILCLYKYIHTFATIPCGRGRYQCEGFF